MNSLQDIMNLHGEAYTKPRTLPSNILKALLPTHYFHIVFTIPEQLNSLTLKIAFLAEYYTQN